MTQGLSTTWGVCKQLWVESLSLSSIIWMLGSLEWNWWYFDCQKSNILLLVKLDSQIQLVQPKLFICDLESKKGTVWPFGYILRTDRSFLSVLSVYAVEYHRPYICWMLSSSILCFDSLTYFSVSTRFRLLESGKKVLILFLYYLNSFHHSGYFHGISPGWRWKHMNAIERGRIGQKFPSPFHRLIQIPLMRWIMMRLDFHCCSGCTM